MEAFDTAQLISRLQEIFPNLSETSLRNLLRNKSITLHNLDAVIDEILCHPHSQSCNKEDYKLATLSKEELNKDGGIQKFPLESPPSTDENRSLAFNSLQHAQAKQMAQNNLAQQLKQVQQERKREWVAQIPGKDSGQLGHSSNYELQDQLKQLREGYSKKWRRSNSSKRIQSLNDLSATKKEAEDFVLSEWGKRKYTSTSNIHTISTTLYDPVRIGKEALEYTNAFRREKGLNPLKWNQSLCNIATKHSKDMGDGRVPFGHQGFDNRVSQYPFQVRSAAENVAMNYGVSDVAKVAVNGWIQSPGHRKNLLSRMDWCGIGVYNNVDGHWYLTQLFGNST